AARAPGVWSRQRLLPPGLDSRRSPGHAPAPSPLPPQPRHAVCRDRPGGAGPCGSLDCGGAVSDDGDDLLAAAGGSGAGADGSTITMEGAIRRACDPWPQSVSRETPPIVETDARSKIDRLQSMVCGSYVW